MVVGCPLVHGRVKTARITFGGITNAAQRSVTTEFLPIDLMNSAPVNYVVEPLIAAAARLCRQLQRVNLSGAPPWIYNPLDYAWEAHCQYIAKYAQASCKIVLLGMNPGPWGMSQTGVPFGEVAHVTQWLKIDARIDRPKPEHPRRPVMGLKCKRREVSGQRFWGFLRERYGHPEIFFKNHFVVSYCPLAFMEESGLNVTPDKLPLKVREPLEQCCDAHLLEVLSVLQPVWLIGVGAWAEKRARRVAERSELPNLQVGRILHPSPASPAANRQWSVVAEEQLKSLGVWS